jgi:abortive infection bacteriophage resistance protein
MEKPVKSAIAAEYGIADKVLESWLLSLNFVRNICAHHSRLWNRGFGNKQPSIPRAHKHPEWHIPVPVAGDSVFGILTVLFYMLKKVAPHSRWKTRLQKLFEEYPDVPLRFMGFPDNWQECSIWEP